MNRLPLNHAAATELVPLLRDVMKLCKVRSEESVLVYADTHTPPHYPAAFLGAAQDLGAVPAIMIVPMTSAAVQPWVSHSNALSTPKVILGAWKNAGMVVDVTTSLGQAYTPVIHEAVKSGTRVLRVLVPFDEMQRMFPTPETIRKVKASAAILSKGKKLRMTSDAGTDVVFDKTGRRVGEQDGVADKPGEWDAWPSAQVLLAPLEDRSEGVLVINTGDVLLRLGRYVDRPITCILEGGRITAIKGEGVDTYLLREWFGQWNDPKAYVVSHIGWGCHDKADWLRLTAHFLERGGLMDVESFGGNVQIAFGNNLSFLLQGRNDTRAHMDITCRDCSFYVDDVLVVDHGKLVHPDLT